MERTGWNAVIYDVDWARFIPGKKCNNVDCKHVGTDITDHCPNCGSETKSDETFCGECGTKLSTIQLRK